jgi:hypothetical protein
VVFLRLAEEWLDVASTAVSSLSPCGRGLG